MYKRKKIHFIFLIVIAVLVCSVTITASATTLSVTRVKQAKTQWCWAATAEMIGSYINNNAGKTQWDIVAYIKGSSYPDEGGSASDIKKGIKYSSGNTVTYASGSTRSWESHVSDINLGYPVGVWMNWDNNSGAHALVCAGTKTSGGSNYLYIIDPWEDNTSEWYKYDSLKNGTTIQSGEGSYDISFWKN